ncbi:U3 small nucleolar RNA-associated 14 homolog A [Pelobates cultripes]|uniref:U3 small nucleolar RNA-associated 14 homolog A n=1 Tax=Pelobates cultripes TaxID=61616 RepID=A0AAD1T2P0_PELCU|nr:U3 small nucleolar RNA-associated 14 homolog A [Pelobates cultripes]
MDEDLFVTEYPVSASEDEGDSDSERKHRKLLDAISSLDGKKRRRLAERSEASLQVSEFGISAEGTGEKLMLSDLIAPIEKSTKLSTVKKQLNKLNQTKSVELPLTKEESNRIQRVVAYKKASEEVSRWDHIVKQNRKAEQLVFPQNDEKLKPTRIEEVVSGWKACTPLEMEIFNILQKNNQPLIDPLLTHVEEASLKAMSLEEAMLRRAELQKARALQSYYESKARREKKIKSKKFHKVLKKSKTKEALKGFEELRKTNPEAALEELQKIERTRMEERMSLKHQNSGKWAKSKAIMAKYDDDARKAIQEQLQKNKDLTRKVEVLSESDESETEEVIPDFVNDAETNLDGLNPWMTGKLSRDPKDSGNQEEEEKGQTDPDVNKTADVSDHDNSEADLSEEETLLQEFEDNRRLRKMHEDDAIKEPDAVNEAVSNIVDDTREEQVTEFNRMFQRFLEQNKKDSVNRKSKNSDPVEQEEDNDAEEPVVLAEESPLLVESMDRKQSLVEMDALGQDELQDDPIKQSIPPSKKDRARQSLPTVTEIQDKKPKLIDHNSVLPVKAHKIKTSLLPTTVEEDEEEDDEVDQKMIIQEAFAGDDVIKDFLKEKRNAEEAGKPKEINLVLPGWGEWGGLNLKPSKRKQSKFIIPAHPARPRKDRRLPNVIINEKRSSGAAAHQVSVLPFPYNNHTHFESTIRAPVGNTWNTERSVQRLIAPPIITKKGHIIEPITEEALQKHGPSKKPDMELNKPKAESKRPPTKHHRHKRLKQKKKQ